MISTSAGAIHISHFITADYPLENIEEMCKSASGEQLLEWIYFLTKDLPISTGFNPEFVKWATALNTIAQNLKPESESEFKMLLASFAIIRSLEFGPKYPFQEVRTFWLGFREFLFNNRTLAS